MTPVELHFVTAFGKVCGLLVKASRHLVRLSNLESRQEVGRSLQAGVEQSKIGLQRRRNC
jgi:hypothetical protein